MKKILIPSFIALFVISWGCREKQEDLLSRIEKMMNTHQTIHYKVTEKALYSWSPDTIITPYEVWAVRDENDTLRHGYVWVDNYYRPYNMIYEQGNFYLAIPPKKTTVLYSNFSEPFIIDVDWIDVFLRPEGLRDMAAGPDVTVTTADTLWQDRKVIALTLTKKNKYGGMTQLYLLDPKDLVPLYARFDSREKNQAFTDELFFSDYTFDVTGAGQLKERETAVLAANPVEREGSDSETARLERMLHTGETAPLFTGKYYTTGDPFALEDYAGNDVIIIDFWYTHCPPCVRAIPALSALYEEKKGEGLKIFGLNSVDNQPHSMDNLKKFLEKRKVSYDIILTQPEVDMQYRINGYPSMYVIDKQGKIAWVEIGFNEEKFEQLKARIDELLKQ